MKQCQKKLQGFICEKCLKSKLNSQIYNSLLDTMSVITSTPKQICDNPLNTSKSKFLYSFSKASRDNLATKPM